MKQTIRINGKNVKIDTDSPRVAKALVALVEACAVRQFKIGDVLEHSNGHAYLLTKVGNRAYLHNMDTGRARNSRKYVPVQGNKDEGFYVEDLPCEKDCFYDPENPDEYLDI